MTVTSVSVYANDSLDSFFTQLKNQPPLSVSPNGRENPGSLRRSRLRAQARRRGGHFTIPGVGVERYVTLSVSGEGRARYNVFVVTRAGFDPKPLNQELDEKMQKLERALVRVPALRPRIHGHDRGREADPRRGQGLRDWPAEGGRRLLLYAHGYDQPRPWPPTIVATSDAAGRFEFRSARKSKGYQIRVEADPVAGHLKYEGSVGDTPGHELNHHRRRVDEGCCRDGEGH